MQLGELLAFDSKSLVVRQMPMQHVHLHGGHAVEVALHHIERDEVTANINQEAAPCKARLVVDTQDRHGKSGRSRFHQLQEGLQAVQHAQRSPGGESRARWSQLKRVGFVLAEFLNFAAGVFAANHQRCLGGIGGLLVQGHSSLAAELVKKSRNAAVETRVLRAGDRHREQLIDHQLTGSQFNLRRNGHQREGRWHLGSRKTC